MLDRWRTCCPHGCDLCVHSGGEGHPRPADPVCVPRLEHSAAGFYEWQRRQGDPSARVRIDAALTETICRIHRQSRGTYGTPRVHADLRLGQSIKVGPQTRGVADARRGPGRCHASLGRGCTRRSPDDPDPRPADPRHPRRHRRSPSPTHPRPHQALPAHRPTTRPKSKNPQPDERSSYADVPSHHNSHLLERLSGD